MKRTYVSFVLAVALMLLALPLAASPGVGPASPRSSIVAKVLDAVADLWSVLAPEVTASSAPAKDADGNRDDPPPLDGLGPETDPWG